MSDLFGESGSDGETAEEDPIPKPSSEEEEPPPDSEKPEEEPEEPVVENGVATEENGKDDVSDAGNKEDRASQEDEEEEDKANIHTTPRDDIRLTVVQYQKAADDFAFEVLVEHNGVKKTIFRNYKDLVWLYRTLSRKIELGGNILPPLPPPPPKSMEPRMVILGKDTKAVYGDFHRLPCLGIEVFLQTLSNHNYFSENDTVHTYLVADQVPAEERLGNTSLWSSFTKAISDMQISTKQDPEEEFTAHLKSIDQLFPKLGEASRAFSQLVNAQQALGMSQVLVLEMLKEHSAWSKDKNEPYSRVVEQVTKALEEEKDHIVAVSFDGRHTLGFVLDLYHSYCTQAKEMLYRRLGKLQTLLSCNAQLDKAKPEKKAAAETAKDNADKAFKLISETAKREIDVYNDQYMNRMKANLIGYAEARIAHSKRTHENLSKICSQLADIAT